MKVKAGVFHDRKGSLAFATTSHPSNRTYLKKRPVVHPSDSSLIPSNAQHRKIVWNFAKSDTQGCRSNPSTWREIDTLALAFLPAYLPTSFFLPLLSLSLVPFMLNAHWRKARKKMTCSKYLDSIYSSLKQE